MTSAHSLQGLMKWLTRAEWRDRSLLRCKEGRCDTCARCPCALGPQTFAEVYDHHLLPACRRTGFDAEEVIAILGENWFVTTVWGCAFEDFLTRESADGQNIVDDYLKRRGWKEGASARTYMSALRASVMSLYEVSGIVRDTSFRARDLVRGGDLILISERLATRSLAQWDRIATRVVEVGSGAPPRLNLSVEERRTIILDGLDRHYRDLLDQPIPVLGNKSPRAAVKTPKGRAKVVDWLKTLENHTAKFAGSNDEMASYNFNWLWMELGVNELRR
jgi:hypothetical protein